MKKLLTSLLAILMVLSLLAACRREEEKAEEKKEPVTEEQGKSVEEKEEEKIPKDFTLGKVDGQTYENTFIKIGCRLPEGWNYLSMEKLNEENGMDAALQGDALLEAYLEQALFLVLTATGEEGSCTLALEKMEHAQLEALEMTDYFGEQLLAMEEAFVDLVDAEETILEVGTVMLDGVTFDCIHMNIAVGDIRLVQYVLAIKCDGYLAQLALASNDEAQMEELLDCFYLLK